jgi:hypothetical protein
LYPRGEDPLFLLRSSKENVFTPGADEVVYIGIRVLNLLQIITIYVRQNIIFSLFICSRRFNPRTSSLHRKSVKNVFVFASPIQFI